MERYSERLEQVEMCLEPNVHREFKTFLVYWHLDRNMG